MESHPARALLSHSIWECFPLTLLTRLRGWGRAGCANYAPFQLLNHLQSFLPFLTPSRMRRNKGGGEQHQELSTEQILTRKQFGLCLPSLGTLSIKNISPLLLIVSSAQRKILSSSSPIPYCERFPSKSRKSFFPMYSLIAWHQPRTPV